MRTVQGLWLVALLSGCFVGETLDGEPAPPASAVDGGATATPGPSPSSPSSPSSSPPAAPTDAGLDAPTPADSGAAVFEAAAADSGPCGDAARLVVVEVSGGQGTITSNPPGIAVATGGTTSACFPIARTVVLEEVSQLLCNWSGTSCKDGNNADRRCEFVVPDGATRIAVVVP